MKRLIRLAVLMIVMQILIACAQPTDGTPTSTEVLTGDAVQGEGIFTVMHDEAPSCSSCHQTEEGAGGLSLGPNLAGVSARATERVADQSVEDYLTDSILDPSAYVVPGFRESMYPEYADHLSAQQIADLVTYLMTL